MSEEKEVELVFISIRPSGSPLLAKRLNWLKHEELPPKPESFLDGFRDVYQWPVHHYPPRSFNLDDCLSEMQPMDGETFAPDFGHVRTVKIPQLTEEAMTRAREVQQLIDRYPEEYQAFEDKERAIRAESHVSIYNLVTLLKQETERFAAFIADLRKREEGERDE